jgi:predicted RNA binding protein YcfA (HicA-like mRNA interferase family)
MLARNAEAIGSISILKAGRVTIAGKPSADMHPKTLADIFKQAQIERPKT